MIPGNMASLRRLMTGGTAVEELLDTISRNPPNWLQVEWKAVDSCPKHIQSAIATLAFYQSNLSVDFLADLCDCTASDLREGLKTCTFIEITSQEKVDFVCDAFRRIATEKLARIRKPTLEHIISRMMRSPNEQQTLSDLPNLLHEAGKHEDLISYLSSDTINLLIQVCESWMPLHQKLEIALKAASKLQRDNDMLRFSMQNSSLTALESAEPWRQEIHAYLALEDYSAISAIAEETATKEDQLHFLSIIARSRKENGLAPDHEINEQIVGTYQMIDTSSLGRRGIEIASDLLYTQPGLAIELVQKCTAKPGHTSNPDIAFAQMSISALLNKSGGMDSTHADLKEKIKDPSLQQYVHSLGLYFGNFSAEAVLAEVKIWEKPQDRIEALKSWMSRNRKNPEAKLVISYAMELILKTTAYTANAGVYYHIASPLPNISDTEYVRAVIARLDGLKGPIEQAGPTIEYVKLQSIMAEAEYKFNRQSAFYRLQELLFYSDKIKDCSTRMESFAVLVSVIHKIDPDQNFSAQEPIFDLSIEGLSMAADEILSKTADHFAAIKPAISILATTQPRLAFYIVEKLNTVRRKDRALHEFIRAISNQSISDERLGILIEAHNKISCSLLAASALHTAIKSLHNSRDNDGLFTPRILQLDQLIEKIGNPEIRCRAHAMFLSIIKKNIPGTAPNLQVALEKKIISEWESIAAGWTQVKVGFKTAKILSGSCPEVARDILKRTEEIRGQVIFDTEDSASCYIGCVRLTIRAFAGLIKKRAFTDNDIEILGELIRRVPCKINQISVWSELAVRFDLNGCAEKCKYIVEKVIRPFLVQNFIAEESSYNIAVMSCSLSLHCAHPPSALVIINGIPDVYSDIAISEICSFIICKKLPFDEFDTTVVAKGTINYESFLDVANLMEHLSSDVTVSSTIKQLVDGIDPKRFKKQFNNAQVADINRRINAIRDSKLPNPKFIRHEGYKILVEATMLRLNDDRNGWSDLLARAKALPNFADSTLVMMSVAENMPRQEKRQALQIFTEAKERIPEIPFFEDRIHHLENLATAALEVDKDFSKACVKAAWSETMTMNQSELPRARKRLIDFAHRLDPNFASSLASEASDDPGRDYARHQAREHIEIIKMRESIAIGEQKTIEDDNDLERCVEVSKMMLSGLNAGRSTTIHLNKVRPFIEHASRMGMRDGYFVLAWVIENTVKRFSDQQSSALTIRPLFESARIATELTFKIAARKRAVFDSGIFAARNSNSTSSLVRSGERNLAISRICEWAKGATGFIHITDPYFGLEDLSIIKLIREFNDDIPIRVVTSRSHHSDLGAGQSWEDAYQAHWRIHVSDMDPGQVTITMIGRASTGEHPIHDRWCLSSSSGIRLGTSINSIGGLKASEISSISGDELSSLNIELNGWLTGLSPSNQGERVKRTTFEL